MKTTICARALILLSLSFVTTTQPIVVRGMYEVGKIGAFAALVYCGVKIAQDNAAYRQTIEKNQQTIVDHLNRNSGEPKVSLLQYKPADDAVFQWINRALTISSYAMSTTAQLLKDLNKEVFQPKSGEAKA